MGFPAFSGPAEGHDKAVSLANAKAAVEEAVKKGAELVVLGEMPLEKAFQTPFRQR